MEVLRSVDADQRTVLGRALAGLQDHCLTYILRDHHKDELALRFP